MNDGKHFVIRCRAVILDEGKLLVVKHAHDGSFYALPGGHLEWGEDPQECLRREVVEELGVEPLIGKLLYVNTFIDKHDTQPVEFFFEVLNGKDYRNISDLVRTHAHELSEVVWASPEDDLLILPETFGADFKAGILSSETTRYIKG